MSKPVLSLGFDVPFTEAIAWAKDRISVLPDTYYNDLPAQARSRAFTVSGLSALDQIQGVLDSLHKATESGETFAQWKKNLTPEVLALGNARLDNIFRTGIQTHYNIGRYQQQEANKAHRPYRMYDAINDGRTRPHHKALDNFIAPIDDPIWKKISPPLGFRCRCSSISLTEAQAKQRGYKVGNQPDVNGMADKGWDYDKLNGQDAKLEQIKAQRLAKVQADIRAAAEKALRDNGAMKPQFVEAKTAKAAGEWAVKNNLADFADYSGIKPEVANAWNKSLFDHIQEFPELRKNQKFVGTCQAQFAKWRDIEIDREILRLKSANPQLPADFDFRPYAEKRILQKKVNDKYAHSWMQEDVSGIAVNKKYGADVDTFKRYLQHDLSKQFHPVGCDTIRSVVDHEMGHQLDALLDLRIDNEVVMLYKDCKTKGMTKEVSGYADKYDGAKGIGEFIAECWGEVCNNPTPRAYARSIGDIVRARYRAKYGSTSA